MSGTELLGWLVAGLIVGVIARILVPGRQNLGLAMTMILGIAGAVVGAVLYNWIAFGAFMGPDRAQGEWDLVQWVFAVLGAVVVVWIAGVLAGPRRYYPG